MQGPSMLQMVRDRLSYGVTDWAITDEDVMSATRLLGDMGDAELTDAVNHLDGDSTPYQALAAGLPSIVVPHVSGQESTARLVTRHGVGVGFEPAKLDERRLAAAVRHLLDDDRARSRAQDFQRRLVGSEGPGTAATAVEALVRPR